RDAAFLHRQPEPPARRPARRARHDLQHRGRLDFPREARRRLLPALEERVRADRLEPARARGRQAGLTMQAEIHYTVDTGAKRVVVFDHTLRSGDETEREAKLVREPVLSAHNDYTEQSGPQRVREIMGDEAEPLLRRRFAIIQVWRAIRKPIQANPLAILD